MKLYEIALPVLDNSGVSYTTARVAWETRAREFVGSYTARPVGRGLWEHDGKIYVDDMVPYRIACSPAQCRILVAEAFRLFPDQVAFCVTEMGDMNIVHRASCGEDTSSDTSAPSHHACLGTEVTP